MQATVEPTIAPPSQDALADVAPSARVPLIDKFLSQRGISRPVKRTAAASPSARPTQRTLAAAPPRPLWHSYSKRRHGQRVAKLQAAMRIPEPDYAASRDAYVRNKQPKRFLDLHADAAVVAVDFNSVMRPRFFEREVVDLPVCDREANRQQYEARMQRLEMEELEALGLTPAAESDEDEETV